MTSAAGVTVSMVPVQGTRAGSIPSAALHDLQVKPIPLVVAKRLLVRYHYLHSFPGGTHLAFGAFVGNGLMGGITLGAGPYLAYHLVEGAAPDDCLTLTRLWLSDDLPRNSESRALGIVVRLLKRHTEVKFLLAYSDPAAGHVGTIYQAAGWLYSGLSSAMPLYDLGDGELHHSRSLAHRLGSHSVEYFRQRGVELKRVPQAAKHRYVRFLDESWRDRLAVPVLPYPKKEADDESY